MPVPCKLTFDLLTLKVLSKSSVTCANFGLPGPLCSRLRPDVREIRHRQMSESIIALCPRLLGEGHNNNNNNNNCRCRRVSI